MIVEIRIDRGDGVLLDAEITTEINCIPRVGEEVVMMETRDSALLYRVEHVQYFLGETVSSSRLLRLEHALLVVKRIGEECMKLRAQDVMG